MYTRKVRNTDENDVTEMRVTDYAFKTYSEFIHKPDLEVKELPEYFVSSSDVKPTDHIKIQAALQKFVDSSISKTINIPSDYPFEDFKDVYVEAYEKGLKGCTTFRPSEYITGVLVKDEDKKKEEKAKEENETARPKTFVPRPQILEGTTYKIKTPLSSDALYITINDLIKDDGSRRPYELFINTKNLQHFSWIVAMTRLISAVFRHDAAPTFLVQELKSIYDPNGGYFVDGGYVPSLAADIGRIIEKHLTRIGIIVDDKKQPAKQVEATATTEKTNGLDNENFMFCPSCNEKALVSQENCLKCLSCNYSKCG
jgi:ribonucleoside-diphosphate reductase alpha chain